MCDNGCASECQISPVVRTTVVQCSLAEVLLNLPIEQTKVLANERYRLFSKWRLGQQRDQAQL